MLGRAIHKRRVFMICIALATTSGSAFGESASPAQVLLLPKFCWSQYISDAKGREYSIPRNLCGVGMNHYCPALIALGLGLKSHGAKRRQYLAVAIRGIKYTLRWMKPYRNCPIRAQVEASLREAESLRWRSPPR